MFVLRVVVGGSASVEASLNIARNHLLGHMTTIAGVSVVIAGLALIFGFLTPVASVMICLIGAGIMLLCVPPSALLLFDSRMASFEFLVMSAVLIILGPGAISVDARLFGRRQVVIPEAPHMNDP